MLKLAYKHLYFIAESFGKPAREIVWPYGFFCFGFYFHIPEIVTSMFQHVLLQVNLPWQAAYIGVILITHLRQELYQTQLKQK